MGPAWHDGGEQRRFAELLQTLSGLDDGSNAVRVKKNDGVGGEDANRHSQAVCIDCLCSLRINPNAEWVQL